MTRYVNKRMIVAINKMSIELTGGTRFAGKNNLIGGSRLDFVDRISKNRVFGTVEFEDIFHQAAAYMYYILKNHPFIDGNKRTALASTITFLQWNKRLFSPLDEGGVRFHQTYNHVHGITKRYDERIIILAKVDVPVLI